MTNTKSPLGYQITQARKSEENILRLKEQLRKAENLVEKQWTSIIQRLFKGETSGDLVRNFVILLNGKANEGFEEKVQALWKKFQKHPGEAILLIQDRPLGSITGAAGECRITTKVELLLGVLSEKIPEVQSSKSILLSTLSFPTKHGFANLWDYKVSKHDGDISHALQDYIWSENLDVLVGNSEIGEYFSSEKLREDYFPVLLEMRTALGSALSFPELEEYFAQLQKKISEEHQKIQEFQRSELNKLKKSKSTYDESAYDNKELLLTVNVALARLLAKASAIGFELTPSEKA